MRPLELLTTVLILSELALYYFAPSVLARIAFLPMLSLRRRLAVPESLWTLAPGKESTYREAPAREIAWSRLPLPGAVKDDELVGAVARGGRELVVRLTLRNNKGHGVAAVRLRREGTTLIVDPRLLPVPGPTWIVAFAILPIGDGRFPPFMLPALVLVVVVNYAFSASRMKKALGPLIERFEADVAAAAR